MGMEYEGQICRAPMERGAFMLPVMVGCSYNRCRFCMLFRHLRYRVLPLWQVEQELRRVYELGGRPQRIFLGDGSAFDLETEHLLQVLRLLERYFPECAMVNMDATVTGILRKTDEEMAQLYAHGVRHLYVGIETGLDDVLTFMNKDHSLAQAYEAADKIQRAGMKFDAHIMTGVAGKGRGMENAEALALFFRRTQPTHIVNFSMFVHEDAPLYENVKDGTFVPADELEKLEEEKKLLTLLETSGGNEVRYDSLHDPVEFRVRGTLPKDLDCMVRKIDTAIKEYSIPHKIGIWNGDSSQKRRD